ncbi:Coenzyme F420 hydrogenase/dehydrogenase, beta subunit C-terminal domain [Aquimarina sp. 2201CG14-23]|uniref:Coenzyme F420 hydrogenase/dehydrogenase, beta subunit C-terminal domain n=1 Tax=Aquimarina mycalae TaxID=3040073 RepID=UPI00247809C9|nr:Coenzyme F420 hydrogenase/dehydrogenase, beta subunit C-terminal domain [Aquimarina sp. 2201CG14-23]MDH7446362.1 Coenzyme F420 hydrogenase/dehydrogenase, beta subunit C-terminal domain [Aquimarina sp. 2201CG14-23]
MTTIEKVIEGNYCIGCGICASVNNSIYKIETTKEGRYKAINTDIEGNNELPDKVCPFSSSSLNEDELAEKYFSDIKGINKDNEMGYNLSSYAGYVEEDNYRELGSSGGGVSWLLNSLLEENLIDAVIHVKEGNMDNIFEFAISNNAKELREGAKSRYYPVEMSAVLKKIRDTDKRYAIVGIPCFIKAIRNLSENDKEIKDRIVYYIGIVCGHLKSKNFTSLFAWQQGIHPKDVVNIDFRHKIPSSSAALYSIKITYKKEDKILHKISKPASELYGTDWGLGFFKYKACDYCDDVLAETADVVFGDAWAAKYRKDWKGSNLVITRNKTIDDLLKKGIKKGKLNFDPIGKDIVIASQGGSFRHRRKGLAYRLYKLNKEGVWAPKKRVDLKEAKLDDEKYIKVQNYRMRFLDVVDEYFLEALEKNSFKHFKRKLALPILRYKFLVYGIRGIIPAWTKDLYRFLFKRVNEK